MNIREKFLISTKYNNGEGQSFCKIFTYWIQNMIWNRGCVEVILFLTLLHKHSAVCFPWAVSGQLAQAFQLCQKVCPCGLQACFPWEGKPKCSRYSAPAQTLFTCSPGNARSCLTLHAYEKCLNPNSLHSSPKNFFLGKKIKSILTLSGFLSLVFVSLTQSPLEISSDSAWIEQAWALNCNKA